MQRQAMLDRLAGRREPFDIVVIGGGATGVGVAVDAASRGYSVALFEQADFGQGTSSRSTKLVHGGVRYLQQGNIPLVMEALKERGLLRQNAPHLVHDLRFVVPNYDWWEAPFYGVGLKIYDLLAGRYGFGPSRILDRKTTLDYIPTLETEGLRGGVQYYDGQFDDARLLIHLAMTAAEQGAALLNHAPVTQLLKESDRIRGVVARDALNDEEYEVRARVVVNATGPFADAVRRMDEPGAEAMIAPSQGVHIVLDKRFLPGDSAIMAPHTADGRVMFAIPWHGHALVGTTDTPLKAVELEPRPLAEEIDLIIQTAGRYLADDPTRDDVLSTFAGIRPLARAGTGKDTAALSREHVISVSPQGLLTIAGGKWTTYRRMARDCVDQAAKVGALDERLCPTRDMRIHGYHDRADELGPLSVYGADAHRIRSIADEDPALAEPLHAALPYTGAEVVWAARHEMARRLEDVLSRRTRALLLNTRAAAELAPHVADLMGRELGWDAARRAAETQAFRELAADYLP